MKRYSTLITVTLLALICVLPVSITAQKSASKSAQRKPTKRRATPTPTPTPMVDMHPEAAKVAVQVKNITLFLYTYGKVVNGMQLAEDQAKGGSIPPAVVAKNKASKDALVNNIRSLRAGLSTLLKEFQSNSRYQVQYLKLSYATETVANAEQLASTGRFDDAGRMLVTTVERLTDTMMSMRLQ
ncbi:MAG TPA: hypothetical protein VJ302_02090 [Blastocatellia bacterium]|nr:hypothetical protein [Blastocatellia bacterium]